jgi:head-tail adaptor
MINFGKYDQKVAFVSFQNLGDGAGGTTPTASTALTTFASVTQTRASNAIESSDLVLPNTYRVGIQYRNSFTPTEAYQILYRSKYYKITGVQLLDERQHKEYVITMVGI